MVITELRQKHPRFVYESYDLNRRDNGLNVQFHFTLEPNINFTPSVSIPIVEGMNERGIENFAFHLGLIEAVSYWKVACPQELFVKAGNLTDHQIEWWHDLFIHGLGELYYKNGIDFTPTDFLSITSNRDHAPLSAVASTSAAGDLIMVGGGKDSAVTLEVLGETEMRRKALVLTPIQSALDNARVAGYEDPIVVQRTMDPVLLDLNKQGYINGHTPFSAYLGFLGVFVASLNDFENVIVSNERGATEGNVMYRGMEINHQYSKSTQFEKLFREYSAKYLSENIQYFSFLRPLYDLQVSRLFSAYATEHDETFRSCNSGQKENAWCGNCAKCAFVYLSLFPFIPSDRMKNIFGDDYFRRAKIGEFITDLVGLGENKPFECVGTIDESKLAVALSIEKYRREGVDVPPLLLNLEQKLGISEETTVQDLQRRLSEEWGDDSSLPPTYVHILKDALRKGLK
ncbi:MAG TPA: hypothetical protein VMR59_04285 [Patescibacteria group bacterium]|jgi:hypothetical protein|nr:hypothetical protein [Patescibacteria group bacterium]